MEFWIALAAIAAVIFLAPRVRWLVKRLVLVGRMKRVCKKQRFSLHGTHALWFLGIRDARRCDVYIETPTQVYAVKLFGTGRRRAVLVFKENGTYFVRHFIALISYVGLAARFPIESKPRRLLAYDFRVGYRDAWEIKTPRNVLLVHPVCMEIHYRPERGAEVILGAGDTVGGMELMTLSRLLGELECER